MKRATIVAILGVTLFVILLGAAVLMKRAELAMVLSMGGGGGGGGTPCWPGPTDSSPTKISVTIGGYVFDFNRTTEGNTWSKGSIDGPLDHNGYHKNKVEEEGEGEGEEKKKKHTLHVQVGDNADQNNDFAVDIIFLPDNKVEVKGKVKGKDVNFSGTKKRKNLGGGRFQNTIDLGSGNGTIIWIYPA